MTIQVLMGETGSKRARRDTTSAMNRSGMG